MGKVQEVISKYETGTLSNGAYQQAEAQNKVQTTLEQLLYSCDINTNSLYSPESEINIINGDIETSNNTVVPSVPTVPTVPTTVLTPQGYMTVRPVQASYPLTPLGSGGFIFNYPPLYSFTPITPFSQQVVPSTSDSSPMSPPTSPSYPTSPTYPNATTNASGVVDLVKRQEKLEKYRQKRVKRNWNRPVDQARRERAQHRVRDEHGHFVSSKNRNIHEEMNDVRTQLQEYRMESLQLKTKLSEVEQQLEEQQKLNSALSAFLHENRVLYPTVPISDLFNTLNPNASYADAFKEKIDFSSIDLHWTESPFLEKDSSLSNTSFNPLDPPNFS